jgi:hypothetical protein
MKFRKKKLKIKNENLFKKNVKKRFHFFLNNDTSPKTTVPKCRIVTPTPPPSKRQEQFLYALFIILIFPKLPLPFFPFTYFRLSTPNI